MILRHWHKFAVLLVLVWGMSWVVAQNPDCPTIVREALAATNAACENTGRNQACYGNVSLQAVPNAGAPAFTFEKRGDLVNVANVQTLNLSALDEVRGEWGVAIMRLQANLPDSIPGQNVTFVLFGNVKIDNAGGGEIQSPVLVTITAQNLTSVYNTPTTNGLLLGSLAAGQTVPADARLPDNSWLRFRLPDGGRAWVYAGLVTAQGDLNTLEVVPVDVAMSGAGVSAPTFGPMQAFYFKSGVGHAPCAEAPDSGILVQTPAGGRQVSFRINDVDVQIASTIYLQAQPGGVMTVTTLEGSARVTALGVTQDVPGGTQVSVPLDTSLHPTGPPSPAQPYNPARLQALPVVLLPLPVSIPVVASVPTSTPLVIAPSAAPLPTLTFTPTFAPTSTLTPTLAFSLGGVSTIPTLPATEAAPVLASLLPTTGIWKEVSNNFQGTGCIPLAAGGGDDTFIHRTDVCGTSDLVLTKETYTSPDHSNDSASKAEVYYALSPGVFGATNMDEYGVVYSSTRELHVLDASHIEIVTRTQSGSCVDVSTRTLELESADPSLTCLDEHDHSPAQPISGDFVFRWLPLVNACDTSLAADIPTFTQASLSLSASSPTLSVDFGTGQYAARQDTLSDSRYTTLQTLPDGAQLIFTLDMLGAPESIVGRWDIASPDNARRCTGITQIAPTGTVDAAAFSGGTEAMAGVADGINDTEVTHTFTAQAGEVVTIRAYGVPGFLPANVAFDLRDPSGAVLASQTPEVDGLTLPTAGTYTLAVRARGSSGGTYVVEITRGVKASDQQSQVFTNTQDANGNYALPFSQTFEAQQGDIVTITARDLGTINPYLTLLDPNQQPIAENDDYVRVNNQDDPVLQFDDARILNFVIPASGTYTAQVNDQSALEGGFASSGQVELTITHEGTFPTPPGGQSLIVTTPLYPATRYQLSIQGKSGDQLSVVANDITGRLNASVALLDSNGNSLVEEHSDSSSPSAQIDHFALPADGDYRIEVNQTNASQGGFINLAISSSGALQAASGGLVGKDGGTVEVVSGTVEQTGDTVPPYVYPLNATVGDLVTAVQLDRFNTGRVPTTVLRDASGTLLATTLNNFIIPATGAYSIEVVDPGPFQMVVTHGARFPLPEGAQTLFIPGALIPTTYWRVAVNGKAGDSLVIVANGTSDVPLNGTLTLFDSRGTSLASAEVYSGDSNQSQTPKITLPDSATYSIELASPESSIGITFQLLIVSGSGVIQQGSPMYTDDQGKPVEIIPGKTSYDRNASRSIPFTHTLEAKAGEKLTITVVTIPSNSIDSVLTLTDANGSVIAQNDNHDEQNYALAMQDSQIVGVEIPADGTYTLQVTDNYQGTGGAFFIVIQRE